MDFDFYNIDKNISFDSINYYTNFLNDNDKKEFFDVSGKEHYKLLAYFSTLFNNKNIIDIGTHRGSSALALSYNPTNTIHSFDIMDKIYNNSLHTKENIKFYLDNIFANFEKYSDLLLNAPIIFLDIDPHDGFLEMDFYYYLKSKNYQGILICDDIWHFNGMRNNFWYLIEDQYKYDLTDYGHWSGTGIVCFNENYKFPKYKNDNWTLVTAYFNLTKCYDASNEIKARDQTYYLNSSISTLSLPNNLVIYCDEESYSSIYNLRPEYLREKTKYVICEFDDFCFVKNGVKLDKTFKDYRVNIIENRKKNTYYFDNRNTASYYLFCMCRYIMLKDVITQNYFNSTHFAWINFCIERMGIHNVARLPEALSVNRDKFSTVYIDYIPENLIKNTKEYFLYGRCSMCSGFFTGNAEYMYKVCDLIENKFLQYLELGYGHADEQLYSPVYFENPELFEQYYGDYHEMITNYKYIYDCPEKPIYNFIRNSFNNKDYKKCLEGCKFVLRSIKLNKCKLDGNYMNQLTQYFINCNMELL